MPLVPTVSGFVPLFLGGEALVRGGSALARRLGGSEIAVGVILVGFGTSAPELLVSIETALLGHADLALGNVLGGNLFNLLGVVAVVTPVDAGGADVRFAMAAMLAPTACFVAPVARRRIGRASAPSSCRAMPRLSGCGSP